jgi:pimeloyl-ACP methyl ester carboxylesterase
MQPQFHTTAAGYKLAYRQQAGEGELGILFCSGFRSDLNSTKATAMAEWCAERKIPFTAFDYFAHGQSEGDFMDYTIGKGLESTLEILDHIATGPQILIGSSMGGWIGLHAARERKYQVKGFIGIAAAPDFTEDMYLHHMTPEQRKTLEAEGVIWVPSDYGSDYPITKRFIEDGREHLLLDDMIPLEIPMHLIQGQQDAEVPWQTALKIAERVMGDEVIVTLVKDAEHRLSRPQDLALLYNATLSMLSQGNILAL